MALYKLFNDPISNQLSSIMKNHDQEVRTSIPLDPDNTDYQEYLEWVAAGNTAEAAD